MKPSASGMGRRRSGVSGERGVDVASLKERGRFGLETGRGLTTEESERAGRLFNFEAIGVVCWER